MAMLLSVLLWVAQSPPVDTAVVARVGRFAITTDDLRTSYEFGPSFVKRRPDPLRRHLDYMIDERLLALEAERLGLDSTAFVRDRRAGLEEDVAVEALYRDVSLSRAHPSEDQIVRDMRRANTNVGLRWIVVRNDDEARALRRSIQAEVSFDSLFTTMVDSLPGPDGRSLETTVLRLERDRPAVAAAIERLRAGQTSEPVRGPDGVYIFHVDRFWQDPIVTETDASKLRHEAIVVRTAITADSIADAHVRSLMRQANPVIKGEGFNIVRALIAERGLSRDAKVGWKIPSTFWTEAGPQPISASGKMMRRTLVTFGNRSFTVQDYARWYDLRQFQLDTRSLAAFNSSVKRTIWKMVQDRLLSEEAADRGMFGRGEVVRQSEAWGAKILYLAGRSSVVRTIRITEADLRSRYARERQRFRDRSGRTLSFKEVRDALWSEEYGQREARTLRDTLTVLRKRFDVRIDEAELRKASSGIVPEPRPLEAVFYKPGGTFPRVAFPTIDEAWERMP